MGIPNVNHPDIEDFITVKSKENVLTNFNVSAAITNNFMKSVKSNKNYPLISPRTKKTVKNESARRIFRLICGQAWLNGDPGVIFIGKINEFNPTPKLGAIESTDSCGEQPLLPYESCNLGREGSHGVGCSAHRCLTCSNIGRISTQIGRDCLR